MGGCNFGVRLASSALLALLLFCLFILLFGLLLGLLRLKVRWNELARLGLLVAHLVGDFELDLAKGDGNAGSHFGLELLLSTLLLRLLA